MRICQHNCLSIRNKIPQLTQFLLDRKISVACFSETHLGQTNICRIKGYSIIRSDRPRNGEFGGGVAIALDSNLRYKELVLSSPTEAIEVCGCEIECDLGKITVLSFYLPPALDFSISDFRSVMSSVNASNLIICGDFNAHDPSWGNSGYSPRGQKIIDFMECYNLVVLNDGSQTFFGSRGTSAVDLTMVSPNLSLISTWMTCRESLGSDHCVIESSFQLNPTMINNVSFSVPKTIDRSLLNGKISQFFKSSVFLDAESADRFDVFGKFFFDEFKHKASNKRRQPNPWWNANCNMVAAGQRLALREYNVCPSSENYSKLLIARRKYKYTIRHEKRLGWKNFCDKIDSNMSVSDLWKAVKCFKGSFSDTLSGFRECVSEFCDDLAGPMGPITDHMPGPLLESHPLVSDITFNELDRAISVSRDTSPGLDGLRNGHLKGLNSENKHVLLIMYNQILASGIIPITWYNYSVIPLKKKLCPSNLSSSYRSIAMASCLRKLFERILNFRLEWFVESEGRLGRCQSGFRKGRSTMDNVVALWSFVSLKMSEGLNVFSVFIDIKGAFDNVNIELLYSRLRALNLPPQFASLIFSLFKFKDLYIRHDGVTENRHSFTGVPQGCVLSPFCFDLYIDGVFDDLPPDIHVLAYADDIVIYCAEFNPTLARNKVQNALNIIGKRLADLQLSLSVRKTKAMIFSSPRRPFLPIERISFENEPVDFVDSFVFLGFTFQKHLSLKPHIDAVRKSCLQFLNVLRSLCGVSWGSDPQCLIRLYIGIIRPKLEYIAPLLLSCPNSQFIRLERIQWSALRTALGAMMSSHTLGLEQIANVMPLRERINFLAEKYINKLLSNNDNPAREVTIDLSRSNMFTHPFTRMITSKLNRYEFISVPRHPMFLVSLEALLFRPVIRFLDVRKSSCTQREVISKFNDQVNGRWRDFERVYTDGSKSGGFVGSGVWYPGLSLEAYFPLNGNCSIFAAEALAIVEALELTLLQDYAKVLIVSDSKSVLQALNSHPNSRSHPYIFRIRDILLRCRNRNILVHLLWVPSHMGLDGNDMADGVASNHSPDIDREIIPIFGREIDSFDRGRYNSIWQNRWDNSEFGRHLYSFAPRVNIPPWFRGRSLSRPLIVFINRLKINHTRCKDHMFRIDIGANDLCSCGESQTTDHLFFHCVNVDQRLRSDLRAKLSRSGISTLSVRNIIELDNPVIFKELFEFSLRAKLVI